MGQPAITGRLVSINVGMPQDVPWRGKTVHTAIWKSPVPGPVRVRRLNIDGDGQGDLAGHGGEMRAVMVYQLDSYAHWQQEFGRDDFVHGQFGENFTVDGLADHDVCIGDRYRIGEAVFEVTQPRVTCYRVGLRMNEPRMAALLVAHRRPGFYLRVIEEGTVQAGQDIVKIADGPESLTVVDADRLLYTADHPREQLEKALRIEALSPGWQTSFRSLLRQADRPGGGNVGLSPAAAGPPPAWPGFRGLRVSDIRQETRNVFSIVLADPNGSDLPAALPGQYLTVKIASDDGGSALVRSYSLSGEPGAPTYRISIKVEPHGVVGNKLHDALQVGDDLASAAPRGTFFLTDGQTPVLLVSAGVGITPVLAMLRALADEESGREVWWVHGTRSRDEHAFATEVRQQLNHLPHSHFHVCYSRPAATDRPGIDFTDTGHIDAELLTRIDPPRDATAYLCGPTAFMNDVTGALVGLGLGPERIRTEIFGAGPGITPGIATTPSAPPHAPPGPPTQGLAVSFARSGLTVPFDSTGYASILELAEACDVPVRWSCRTGVCHTCETAIMNGDVDYDPDPVDPPGSGDVLICCSTPRDDVVIDL
ncbi:MOSC domain-containing protein [Rhodococcus sp. W8901]|uniref:MOSC domain-containing protein n=1 Tax=Rhodococcus sp. W8901 TaxID=2742603 RepID=UPI0015838D01|nr:MOSC domain-containing protein [Rhodococcus sp. W8901]QKT11935.1 MOSC domain-containing protein [Rhodococcus sp. W8901]